MRIPAHTLPLLAALTLSGCILPVPHYSTRFQGVSGQVCDARTQKPIPGVRVSVDEHPEVFTTTDAEGRYLLKPQYTAHGVYVWFVMGDSWPHREFMYPVLEFEHPEYQTLRYNAEYGVDNAKKLPRDLKPRKGNLKDTNVLLQRR